MKKFMFETSLGIVKCTINTSKPVLSSDPDYPNFVLSEGEVIVREGSLLLDKLYRWNGLRLKGNWVIVDLDDSYYGLPEYRIVYLPLL